jgi:hypothetical protein
MPSQPAYQDDRAAGVNYPEIRPVAPWRVAEVEALPGWRVRVRHNDGVAGIVDMSRLIHSPVAGVFAALKDETLFRQVHLDLGAVTWPGEIDLSPYAMHDEIAANGEWVLN